MDWFRSHHGAPSDPKWLVIARKAKVSPALVVATFWTLLDHASQQEVRGDISNFDPESAAAFLGMEDEEMAAIMAGFEAKGLIGDGRITSWDKRQPRREREGNSADRVQRHREARRATANHVTPCNATVTPCNASDNQETPRLDKSRVEESRVEVITTAPITPLTPQPETVGSDAEASWVFSEGDEISDPWEELPARVPEPIPAPKPSTAPKPASAPKRTVHRQHSKLTCVKTVAANRYDLAEWFESTFWRAYPRREAAPNAWKAIEKAFTTSGMEQADFERAVMECLGLFKASAQWQDVTKVPHPATWVNRAPWESDAPPTGQTQAAQAGQGWQSKPTQRERGEALAQHHWNKLQEELRQMGASPVGWN